MRASFAVSAIGVAQLLQQKVFPWRSTCVDVSTIADPQARGPLRDRRRTDGRHPDSVRLEGRGHAQSGLGRAE